MEITAHIPPRESADWTEEIARSALGRPVTLPALKGQVERHKVGAITAAKVENGFLVLTMEVQDYAPTGSISLEVMHKLREREEFVLSAAILPNLKPVD